MGNRIGQSLKNLYHHIRYTGIRSAHCGDRITRLLRDQHLAGIAPELVGEKLNDLRAPDRARLFNIRIRLLYRSITF
jgi:hypothetical protein